MVFAFLINASFSLMSYLTFNETPSLAIIKALPNVRILETFSFINLSKIAVIKMQNFYSLH